MKTYCAGGDARTTKDRTPLESRVVLDTDGKMRGHERMVSFFVA